MRCVDEVVFGVGRDIRIVYLGPIAFSGMFNYQLVGENLFEVLNINWLYPICTDCKKPSCGYNYLTFGLEFGRRIQQEGVFNSVADLLPRNTRKKTSGEKSTQK